MDLQELISLAFEALKRNIVRTLLTMLGIIIGIASVITIISLGEGSTQSIVSQISAFGANVLTVSPGKSQRTGHGGGGGTTSTVTTLTSDDAEAVDKLYEVETVSRIMSKTFTITANSESSSVQVTGADASYGEIQGNKYLSGSFFDEGDVIGASKDIVLGDQVVEDLFGEGAEQFVIGETVRVDGRVFQVVGVVSDNSGAVVPITTAQGFLIGQTHLDSISVAVIDVELIDKVTEDIEILLMDNHGIDDPELIDFGVRSSQAFVETISSVTGTLTALLSGIAAISLLVGGIGIMNIMLVTVTERTKEIGLLKAVGAKNQSILVQFLIEAVVLTFSGGFVGIVLGAGLAFVASNMMSIPFVIRLSSVLLSFGVSVGVGILFGYYPAKKAAKLSPIDALRYE
jgi:putative ABC transport system permease protein